MVQDMLPLCLCLQFAFCYFFGFWSQGELDRKSNFPIIYTPTIIPDSSAYTNLLTQSLKMLSFSKSALLLITVFINGIDSNKCYNNSSPIEYFKMMKTSKIQQLVEINDEYHKKTAD